MAIPRPSDILNAGSSYVSQASSILRNPTNLLAGTPLSFLSNSTLSRMEGRSDPQLNCFFNVELPVIKKASYKAPVSSSNALINFVDNKLGGFLDSATQQVGKVADKLGYDLGKMELPNTSTMSLANEYVEECNLVFKEYSSKELWRAGGQRKYVDNTVSLGDLQLKFYAGLNSEALTYLNNWHLLVMCANEMDWGYGGFGLPSDYKYPIIIHTTDENDTTLYTFAYSGCWPKSISEVQLDSNGERITYDVTFSVDDVLIYATSEFGNVATKLNNLMYAGTSVAGGMIGKGVSAIKSTFLS